MSFELLGKLIVKEEVVEINQSFRKQDFVIEVENERNSDWNDFVKFQITQDRCALLNEFNIGDYIKVNFNIRGRKWEKDGNINYITNLEAWRLDKVSSQQEDNAPELNEEDIGFPDSPPEDDLPF
ncbi:DUF3127 domain-containing protein [Bacteroidota bacterium]